MESILETSRAGSQGGGLLDRIFMRKRAALAELNSSELNIDAPPRQRARLGDLVSEITEEKVAVQRFNLVSRGAPPAKRAPAHHGVILAPPRVAAQLGGEVQICRCSQCDRSGVRRRLSGRRMCRRDTESHPEYALLLNLSDRFEAECSARTSGFSLVSEACCREKTAYFILGPGSTTVGYVAAEVAANRRVRKAVAEGMLDTTSEEQSLKDDSVPTVLQIYVEPEFRRQGFAFEALSLLLREHNTVKVDDPDLAVRSMLTRLGFKVAGSREGETGRPMVTFTSEIDVC